MPRGRDLKKGRAGGLENSGIFLSVPEGITAGWKLNRPGMYSSIFSAEQLRLTQKAEAQTIRAVACVSSSPLSFDSRLDLLAPWQQMHVIDVTGIRHPQQKVGQPGVIGHQLHVLGWASTMVFSSAALNMCLMLVMARKKYPPPKANKFRSGSFVRNKLAQRSAI